METNPILTPDEMRELDKQTLKQKNISEFTLMQQAADACMETLVKNELIDLQDDILIVAGPGNNGGDALCLARGLVERDYRVTTMFAGERTKMSDSAKKAYDALAAIHEIFPVADSENFESNKDRLQKKDVIIEGLFGLGLTRPVEGVFKNIIQWLNHAKARIVSIDIPSGLNANNGLVEGIAVRADHTLVIQNMKTGNLYGDASDHHGEILMVDAGIVQDRFPTTRHRLDTEDYVGFLPKRKNNTYKYDYGSVLVIGGSRGMEGAPILSALAAYRSGSGLVRISFSKTANLIHTISPVLQVETLDEKQGAKQLLHKKDAVLFGVGLGRTEEKHKQLLRDLLDSKVPMVIDADGLYYLKEVIKKDENLSHIVITPHHGELALFLGVTSKEIRNDPIGHVETLVDAHGLNILLKGPCTLIARPGETIFADNPNPALAKGGSGDVLSGIILSLTGRGKNIFEAATFGQILLNQAAKAALEDLSEQSLLATDVISCLSTAIKMLQ